MARFLTAVLLATPLPLTAAGGVCNADNCLRAMRATQTPGQLAAAQSFCATFTATPVTVIGSIPTFILQNCPGSIVSRISSACSCITTSPPVSTSPPSSTSGPCVTVSSLSAAQKAATPTATPVVLAQLGYECLNSVPLGKDKAIQLVDAILPYVQWQSDLAYKKHPPADYFYPPLDVIGKLNSVRDNLENGVYPNEYMFQADLYEAFALSHDGHFIFYPDALTRAIEFGHGVPLVSVSSDGSEIPKIYFKNDLVSSTASAVTKINGEDAATSVGKWAYTASFNQDPDAAYNSMFYERAFDAAAVTLGGYWSTDGRMRYIYPGANTTYEFANGTVITVPNIARVKGDFDGVVDGATFYETFCGSAGSTVPASAPSTVAADTTAAGYPKPVVITNDTIVSCYYLDGAGFEDVAVLSMLAFESDSPPEFQAVVQACIADAKAAGKNKMVIDVQANGGGYILQGYDAFRQFFPSIIQDGFSRLRESETFMTMAKLFSDSIPADYDPSTASDSTINVYESFLNYRYDLNLTNQNFSTFEDKFAPHDYQGDPYTSILRWNLSDPLLTINSTFGIGMDITGYGSRTGFTQPFAAENIIMLYDGFCASTCTLFSEMMRIQGGVRSVMFGGRPGTGPIQAVGGIKGAQSFGYADILAMARYAKTIATPEQQRLLAQFTRYPISRSSTNGLNLRDQILRGNVNDGLPAQYVVEEADCRLFWTKPMINDVREVWKAAAKAAWGGGMCVAGSLGKRTSAAVIEESTAQEVARPWDGVTKRFNMEKRFSKSDKTGLWAAKHVLKVID